ncbi:NAD(P)/FAD-dependent oxidoreductase [Allosphingosinicella deserti]|uniref:Thioredoxin reductase n=1 Tax=Allosphingosinicella deserti TaxID=2116704 RepID=A0A2P7QQV3_9SPHN|nr:thioredoxin reductase [Sphingomonas deserti]
MKDYDVVVIGGSFAGQSAAMQLARARQDVLLVDAGLPRNRFAEESHGFLGQDGRAPSAIIRTARCQLDAYPTATIKHGLVHSVEQEAEHFLVSLDTDDAVRARRMVLATGVSDELPQIPGLAERWGATVLHCPYCHGYEVRDQRLGVIANHPLAAHQASLIPDWGPTILFTQGRFEPDEAQMALLGKRGVDIERTPVVELVGEGPGLSGVRLADERFVELGAIFTNPHTRISSPIAERMGCALEDGPTGKFIRVDEWGLTSLDGVYAAGDAAMPMHNATLASASGVRAGVAAHRSLATG